MKSNINDHTLALLRRPLGGVVSINDVFAHPAADSHKSFWHVFDPDAAITEWHGNRPYSAIDAQLYLDPTNDTGGYISVLVDDLVHEAAQRVEAILPDSDYASHPDTIAEVEQSKNAQAIILNSAPRSRSTTKKGTQNGRAFYLAVTRTGVEVYATPLVQLSALEQRHRIIALYEILNKDNPVYTNSEQFRSRLISRVRRRPDCLRPIFQYAGYEELAFAKQSGKHPKDIGSLIEAKTDSIVYADRFGNLRLEFIDGYSLHTVLHQKKIGQTLKLTISNEDKSMTIDAVVAHSLRDAPEGQFAIYTNKADRLDALHGLTSPHYAELVVQGDVTKSSYISAADKIHKQLPDFIGARVQIISDTP